MTYRFLCWFGLCWRCAVHDTPDGIGGKCIDCGKIHGWVTREELRAYGERMSMRGTPMTEKQDVIAPPGMTWICCACGKTEKNRYGNSAGWDESCMLNAQLFDDARIVRDDNGRVVRITEPTP